MARSLGKIRKSLNFISIIVFIQNEPPYSGSMTSRRDRRRWIFISIKSMWNTAVGIKNCEQLFSLRVAFTTQKKATRAAEMMSVECVAIFWVVNASSGEKSCLQFSIPTGSGAGGDGGVSHSLKVRWNTDRAAMSAREWAEFFWTTFRPVFDEIRL